MSVYKLPKVKLAEDLSSLNPIQTPVVKPMQVARTGEFFDERYGTFPITRKMFEEMVKNFDHGVRGVNPALDYKHEAEDIAAGWFKKVYIKDNSDGSSEFWGDIEITPRCQKVLADKEYGYLSIDMDTAYEDNETGKKFGCVLLGAGLTNRPVIKRMRPVIQLSETKQGETMDAEKEKKLADMEAKCTEEAKKLSDAGYENIDMMIKAIADMKAELEAMKAKGGDKPAEETQMGEMKQQLSEITKKLQLAEQKNQQAQKENEFNKLLAEGKACAAQREAFIKGDMAAFVANAGKVKLSEEGTSENGQDDEVKDVEDQINEKATEMAKSQKIRFSEAVSRVLKENPKLAEQRNKKFKGE